MTAAISAPMTPNVAPPDATASTTPPASKTGEASNADFARLLADQRQADDTDAPSAAAVDASTDADMPKDAEGADHADSADTQLAELTLAIAAQVAELQGAARPARLAHEPGADSAMMSASTSAATRAEAGAGPRPGAAAAHTLPGTDQGNATGTAQREDALHGEAALRRATVLPGTAPSLATPPTLSSARTLPHASAPRTSDARALLADPATAARDATHVNAHASRDGALLLASTPVHAPASVDALPQTGEHALATDPGASALPLPDAMPRASGDAASPAPALPAIAAPLASPQWGRELGQRLVMLSQHGDGQTHSAELRLDPPELGPLRVTLTLTDGVAHAAFVSPHAHVRHSLEAALDHLHATLAQAGIELGQTSVSDQPAQHGQPGHTHPSLPPLRPATDTPPAPLGAAPPAPRRDGLVDAYV